MAEREIGDRPRFSKKTAWKQNRQMENVVCPLFLYKQEFLLKFEKDRNQWIFWLFEARKRYGLCVLNYMVTSNHIHLLVVDTEEKTIPQSIQLIAGRTAQEYNIRKKRKGSFWEDRYHATAVDTDYYLAQCMVYIDLNMVRAGAVSHPSDYKSCGYNEIQNPPKRYSIINRMVLLDYFSMRNESKFRTEHENWITVALKKNTFARNPDWSEAIAVGDKSFLENIREELAGRTHKRSIAESNGTTGK